MTEIDEKRARAIAGAKGHTALKVDPPAGLTAVRRWTCETCGRSVLVNLGNVYGSATTDRCNELRAVYEGIDRG